MIDKSLIIYCIIAYVITFVVLSRFAGINPEQFRTIKILALMVFLLAPLTFPFVIYGGVKQKLENV